MRRPMPLSFNCSSNIDLFVVVSAPSSGGDLFQMSDMRSSARATVASKIITSLLLLGAGALVQGCSSSNRDGGDGGSSWKLWGNDSGRNEQQAAANKSAPAETWKQPSSFDNDGPPAGPVYRGGRDPVTGRAGNEWPPASSQNASLAPLPASTAHYPPQSSAQSSAPSSALAPYRPVAPVASAPTAAYASAPSARPLPAAAPAAVASAPGGVVEVKQGDTLYRIAKAHNVTVPALVQANGLPNETIKLGQRLTIPAR